MDIRQATPEFEPRGADTKLGEVGIREREVCRVLEAVVQLDAARRLRLPKRDQRLPNRRSELLVHAAAPSGAASLWAAASY